MTNYTINTRRNTARVALGAVALSATLMLPCLAALPFLTPCEYEDSSFCTWEASTRGNGRGTSFTDYGIFTIDR